MIGMPPPCMEPSPASRSTLEKVLSRLKSLSSGEVSLDVVLSTEEHFLAAGASSACASFW